MAIEKEIAIGSEGKLDIKFDGGKAILTITHVHASGQLSFVATEDEKYFLEILKARLPAYLQPVVSIAEAALP